MTTHKKNSTLFSVRQLRFVIYTLLPAFLIVAFVYDIDLSGRRVYRYRLDTPVTTISKLFPAQRLAGIANGEQRAFDLPIYFTARYPHRYDRVRVTVDADNPQNLSWLIGIEVQGSGSWSYFLEDPDKNGTVEFALDPAKVSSRSLRFIIDAKNFTSDSFFAVRSVTVELIRS